MDNTIMAWKKRVIFVINYGKTIYEECNNAKDETLVVGRIKLFLKCLNDQKSFSNFKEGGGNK